MHTTKIGLFGIGLEAYWPQFTDLKARLEGYLGVVEGKLQRPGIEIVNFGLIDTPEKAFEAGHAFRRADVDLVFLHVTTYALSSTVLPVVQRAKVPVIILNLSPEVAIDYAAFNAMGDRTKMTGEWLAHCGACPVPEIANVFNRARIDFHQITGQLQDDPECWSEVDAWMEAARVAGVMWHNRLGLMGHYYVLEEAGYGGKGEFVGLDVKAMRTQAGSPVTAHLTTSREIFLHLVDKVRSFDRSFEQECVEARDYEALEAYILKHLLGVAR